MKRLVVLLLLISASTSWAIIDMKNANFSDRWVDMQIPGSGYDLQVTRTYNSRSLFNGMFGFGWCSNFETSLEVLPEGSIKVTECGDGLETIYTPKSGSDLGRVVGQIIKSYKASSPKPSERQVKDLEQEILNDTGARSEYAKKYNVPMNRDVKDGSLFLSNGRGVDVIMKKGDAYTRTLADGTSQRFDLKGNLSQMYDKNGNYIKFNYRGDLMIDVVDNNGRKLTFSYYQNNKVKEIVGPNKMIASYTFKDLNNLATAKAANGNAFSYEYDDLHNMTNVKFPDGTSKHLTYDTNKDWVTSFKDRDNCTEKYEYTLAKDNPKNHYWSTVEKKCEGKVTNRSRFEFWYKNRKTGTGSYLEKVAMDVNGDKTEIVYHEIFGKPISMKKNGKTTTFTYLDNGLVKSREFNKEVTTFSYEPKFNKVAQVKVGKRVTDFTYDTRGNLTLARNSGGQIVKLDYDNQGRISYIEDQAKRKIKIAYEERFGKPKYVERVGVGAINVSYKPTGEINKIESDAGPSVAVQVASTFNNLLEVISPAGVELGL